MYEFPLRNLLEIPEKYQQSPFYGAKFLRSFKESRHNTVEILKEKGFEILNVEEVIKKLEPSQISSLQKDKDIITRAILQKLFCTIKNDKMQQEFFPYLNKFIKTFEINKKIFSKYSSNFKPSSENFDEMLNYVLLSNVLLYKHTKLKNLKFLNTSLKLNDLISSQHKKLNDQIIISVFLQTLETEMCCISDLSKSKGVLWQ